MRVRACLTRFFPSRARKEAVIRCWRNRSITVAARCTDTLIRNVLRLCQLTLSSRVIIVLAGIIWLANEPVTFAQDGETPLAKTTDRRPTKLKATNELTSQCTPGERNNDRTSLPGESYPMGFDGISASLRQASNAGSSLRA